jgi:phosphatidylglycerol---prolipoprotein diacylglyceryl transferase
MTSYFHQPNIDPVLIHLWGPLQIRWYSLLYVGGFLVGLAILKRLAREKRFLFTPEDMEQFILWLLIGAVVGSRIIYCVVYDPKNLLANPLYLFQTWRGGLAFHGGLLGTVVAAIFFSRKKGIPFWNLTDAMALATPTGLAMGRLGNFINGELYGRASYVPWAVIFKDGGPEPRHPSQLYEFFLEGVLLFAVLWLLKKRFQRDGQISILFLIGYSLSRFIVEFFREPDAHVGYLAWNLSMGQILSLVMFIISSIVGVIILRQPAKKKTKARGG